MTYEEKYGNLFDLSKSEYVFTHCIAADLKWGAGIAPVLIKNEFNAENLCRFESDGGAVNEVPFVGTAVLVNAPNGKFFNLITKAYTRGKPTYDTLEASLIDMKKICIEKNFNKIAMPRIGCGLDRLDWNIVSKKIKNIFDDTDFEIQIRYM